MLNTLSDRREKFGKNLSVGSISVERPLEATLIILENLTSEFTVQLFTIP